MSNFPSDDGILLGAKAAARGVRGRGDGALVAVDGRASGPAHGIDQAIDPVIPAIGPDGTLYRIGKLEAHRLGALHLAISVFVFDGPLLLIQRRAFSKYHCGGLWANTCCTHPHWGETLPAAARRRLREELGFELALTETRTVEYEADVGGGLTEHERVSMYVGAADRHRLAVRPNPAEVCETRWVSAGDLKAEVTETPDIFTPWFRIYLERYPNFTF